MPDEPVLSHPRAIDAALSHLGTITSRTGATPLLEVEPHLAKAIATLRAARPEATSALLGRLLERLGAGLLVFTVLNSLPAAEAAGLATMAREHAEARLGDPGDTPEPIGDPPVPVDPEPELGDLGLPDRSILWMLLDVTPDPLAVVHAIAYALDNGQEDLGPLPAVARRDLGAILQHVADRIARDGL